MKTIDNILDEPERGSKDTQCPNCLKKEQHMIAAIQELKEGLKSNEK